MTKLTAEKLNQLIAECQAKCDAIDTDKLENLDKGMALIPSEHFQYQKLQSEAHAMEWLTTDAAQIVYNALGETLSSTNGGWTKNTNTATKCIITQLMAELLKLKLKVVV